MLRDLLISLLIAIDRRQEKQAMFKTDEIGAIPIFSEIPASDLERVAKSAADLRLAAGEWAVHEGDEGAFYAVVSGKIEVLKMFDGVGRTLGWRLPGTVFGEVPLALGSPFPGGYRAAEPSRILRLTAQQYYAAAAAAPEIARKMGALARERIGGLQKISEEPHTPRVKILGHRWESVCSDLRRFLARNQISFEWITPDAPDIETKWPGPRLGTIDAPILRVTDGPELRQPETRHLAKLLGLQISPNHKTYDTVVIGGGPAGLAAAVYGASEGLRTLVIEREAPGGQAGTSSRIENYLGFPSGVSGDELATRALQQARRLGAEILVTRSVGRLDAATREVFLDGGEVVRARTLILATGVAWRRLAIEGLDKFIGKGVYYGASRSEVGATQGLDIHLVGAGNSAAQAALYFAGYARKVTLLVRGPSLEGGMSQYLVEQIRSKSNIAVELQSEVHTVQGDAHLTAIDIRNGINRTVSRHDCGGLFIFIGADAETAWLPPDIARDRHGYVLTGEDVTKSKCWSSDRDPYLLETSVPGIFACGDVRLNLVKRVASAVGEGSMAIAFVHRYLANEGRGSAP
jgi:thioredoxin reductase (NADPH)